MPPIDRTRWPDRELLAAVAEGDGEAFSTFYRRHLGLVVGFLGRETGEAETAADLTAEVFAAVALAARRYRPDHDSAGAWLIGIARNTLGSSRRRGRVEARARQRLGCAPLELWDEDLDRVEALIDAEGGHAGSLLAGLPPKEREAVTRRVIDGEDYPTIATELRCSEMVIRKRVSRGLARLRADLGGSR